MPLNPYAYGCTSGCHLSVTFPSLKQWSTHEEDFHGHIWACKVCNSKNKRYVYYQDHCRRKKHEIDTVKVDEAVKRGKERADVEDAFEGEKEEAVVNEMDMEECIVVAPRRTMSRMGSTPSTESKAQTADEPEPRTEAPKRRYSFTVPDSEEDSDAASDLGNLSDAISESTSPAYSSPPSPARSSHSAAPLIIQPKLRTPLPPPGHPSAYKPLRSQLAQQFAVRRDQLSKLEVEEWNINGKIADLDNRIKKLDRKKKRALVELDQWKAKRDEVEELRDRYLGGSVDENVKGDALRFVDGQGCRI